MAIYQGWTRTWVVQAESAGPLPSSSFLTFPFSQAGPLTTTSFALSAGPAQPAPTARWVLPTTS